jgi:hypothetical protein
MFNLLEQPYSRINDTCEGFGYLDDVRELDEVAEIPGIKAGSFQTVMFKPLCGLFNQSKYLPLRYMPIEIELELADNEAPIITNLNTAFTAANTSISWTIQNCQIKCDILSLDNALDNSYVNHLLGGNTLNIVYDTYIYSIQTVTSGDCQVHVSRSLTSLRSVFMSLYKTFTEGRIICYNKSWNTFWSTMVGVFDGPINWKDSDNEIQHLQLMIGSKLYPQYPIRSHAACFYNLRKSLGIQANALHSTDIKGNAYRNNNFIVGFDTEQMLGLAFTRINTKNSLMSIRFKTKGGDNQATRMHIVLVAQQVI